MMQKLSLSLEGHINEYVERWNFRHRVEQPRKTFDDLLVSLLELAKTCKFYSAQLNCTQKNIIHQINKGLLDGDTMEHLTLDKAITTCQHLA